MGRNNDRAGLRFLIGSPNWTKLPTIRHSLVAKSSTKRKKKGGKRDALSSPFTPTNLHGGTTTAL